MSFKDFLVEDAQYGTKSVTEQVAIKWARSFAKNNIQLDRPVIVRGVNIDKKFAIASPITHNRQSANTSNEYTTVISNAPEWDKFPKRSESLICGTMANYDYASQFGKTFVVLPCDKWPTKIGVASTYDFWYAFKYMVEKTNFEINDLFYFNKMLRNVFMDPSFKLSVPTNNVDWGVLQKAFEKITELVKNEEKVLTRIELFKKLMLDDIVSGKITFEEWVRDTLHPSKNKIRLLTYSQLSKISDQEKREVWLSNNCLLIRAGSINGSTASREEALENAYAKFRKKVLADEV